MTLLQQDPPRGRVAGVAYAVLGSGPPVTVFAHGLGGSVLETRPLAARVAGTRVLLTLRGHGDSDALPAGFDYDTVAADLLAVADATGADRAVGLSLAAGGLLRVLSREPGRFAGLALVLPAALDRGRPADVDLRFRRLADAVDGGDAEAVTDLLMQEVPDEVRGRRGARAMVARRAALLVGRPAPRPRDGGAADPPVPDRAVLAAVRARVLVVAQQTDPLHPLEVARDLHAALPDSQLVTLPAGGVFWTAAREAQQAVAAHLSDLPVRPARPSPPARRLLGDPVTAPAPAAPRPHRPTP